MIARCGPLLAPGLEDGSSAGGIGPVPSPQGGRPAASSSLAACPRDTARDRRVALLQAAPTLVAEGERLLPCLLTSVYGVRALVRSVTGSPRCRRWRATAAVCADSTVGCHAEHMLLARGGTTMPTRLPRQRTAGASGRVLTYTHRIAVDPQSARGCPPPPAPRQLATSAPAKWRV